MMRTQFTYVFPRPSVTASIVIFGFNFGHDTTLRILTGIRGRGDGAYAGYRCVPGGFLDAKVDTRDVEIEFDRHAYMGINGYEDQTGVPLAEFLDDNDIEYVEGKEAEAFNKPGERIEETAIREVREETGLILTENQLRLFHVHSDPLTDPRCHVVNVCYYVVLDDKVLSTAVAGDDLAALEMVEIPRNGDVVKDLPEMAFNHRDLVIRAWSHMEDSYGS